jgi:rhamnose utilization protein RhaD (predicted bifunctional aldolase and dehydrogenase)/NAD(P)-dependent dehydrogenase (short-subunit alcohol dehydrogenase family)
MDALTIEDAWPTFEPDESDLEQLSKLSRYYGANPEYVLAGGGNTSVKDESMLHVKASGFALSTIGPEGFVALDRGKLQAIVESDFSDEAGVRETQFKDRTMASRVDPADPRRPSVESVLHHLMPGRFVVHTHSVHANAVGCCKQGQQLCEQWFDGRVLWIPYVEPGIRLAQAIGQAMDEYRRDHGQLPVGVLMANHGMIVSGDTPDEVKQRTDEIIETIRTHTDAIDLVEEFAEPEVIEDADARKQVVRIAPMLRGLLAGEGPLPILLFDDEDFVGCLVGTDAGREIGAEGPLVPDQIVYSGSYSLWVEPAAEEESDEQLLTRLRQAVDSYVSDNGTTPRIVLVDRLGMFAIGDSWASANTARLVYLNAASVMATARSLGGVQAMADEDRRFIETWEAESYRKGLAKASSAGRATGKVALVTGAAQGFGLEIAQDLAAEGAHVMLADINAAGAIEAADALETAQGLGRASATAINVTNAASVAQAICETVRAYGGIDLLVSNAGVLKAGSVKDLPESDFDFVTSVNYKGYFLCVQSASPVMARQHAARPDAWTDIVQINSKSGLVGSNRNGAYAGGKFGGIGLTQSFALELVTDGIKVNSICPGNFFEGPLWSDPQTGLFAQYLATGKVPGAKTIDDVRAAYEAKVPMQRGCRTADVMKAIYYVMEQDYETGQAIPVTGGQVMLS